MALMGNLSTMPPGELLQWLSVGHKTGSLIVTDGPKERRLYFQTGRLIATASNDPRSFLGTLLVEHSYISEAELNKAIEVQFQTGIFLGKILVMIEAISEEELVEILVYKSEEDVYDIFEWPGGEFAFQHNELPDGEMVPLYIDTTRILLEGSRRVDERERGRTVESRPLRIRSQNR